MLLPLTIMFLTTLNQIYCGPTTHNPQPSIHTYNSTTCDSFQATFDVKRVIGTWQVVAIIPEKLFPDRDVNCYSVEFCEIDGASLRWLVNKTKITRNVTPKVDSIKGTIVRQRYHTEQPFDVWSKSVEGVNGCFQQVLSLDVGVNDTQKALTHDAMMQLHLVKSDKHSEPFLLQMLWGRLISVVVYRRNKGVTQEQLKPVFELMSKLRGPQRLPKICENPLRDLLFF